MSFTAYLPSYIHSSQQKNKINLYKLSRLLGHENISITQRYLEGIKDESVLTIARKSGVLFNLK